MLHLAAKAGHAEVVQLDIDDYKLNPTACDNVSLFQAKLLYSSLNVWGQYVSGCYPESIAVVF